MSIKVKLIHRHNGRTTSIYVTFAAGLTEANRRTGIAYPGTTA